MIKPKSKLLEVANEDFNIPEFDPSLVSKEVVMEELKKHQSVYLAAIVSAKTELKFLEDSVKFINDLEENNPEEYKEVESHWLKAQKEPTYFQKVKVDPKLHKALGNIQNAIAKVTEVKKKLWEIEYHSQRINEVRGYLANIK